MSIVLMFLAMIVVLFVAAFLTRRRFGVLGLALTAGATLSSLWAAQLTPLVAKAGLELVAPPLESVVAAALVLLPAVLLFFSGPTYHHTTERVIGSLAFAILAVAFLLQPLGNSLVLDETGQTIYRFFTQNQVYIVTLGLAFAIFDLLTTRTPKHRRDHSKH